MTVYYQQFDFNKIPLKGVVIEKGTSAPASPVEDQAWIDTNSTPHLLKLYDGSAWQAVGYIPDDSITDAKINSAAAIALSKLATNPLARANHTGSQSASTISDFDTQVRTSSVDQLAALGANFNANTWRIVLLDDPQDPTDAVNLRTVQNAIDASRTGFRGVKEPVRVAAQADVNLASPGAIDGVTLADGERFLAAVQTDPAENGIYEWHVGGATRAADADDSQVGDGTFVAVGEGTNAGYIYVQQNDLSTDPQDWQIFQTGGTVYTAGAGLDLTGNTFSLPNVTVARGGTGATTAAGARTNLGAAGGYGETVAAGDFSPGVPVTVTHGLGSIYVGAYFTDDATGGNLGLDWRVVDANSIELTAWATVTNDINVAVFGA